MDELVSTWIVAPLSALIFFDVVFWDDPTAGTRLPLVVLVLSLGGLFATIRLGLPQLRYVRHAVAVIRGRYDDPNDPGEVTHFQALSSALSGTVGLGNIAGVAVAIGLGGPGATVWMTVSGLLGMAAKMLECTLGLMHRTTDAKGRVVGGPMRYLAEGLAARGWPRLGRGLAVVFALMCIGGALGGGNMFQSNQSFVQVASVAPFFSDVPWLYGVLLAALVGAVVLGGIKRIGEVAERLVPAMCLLYVVAALAVLAANWTAIPDAVVTIVREAFTPRAGLGGVIGVMVVGFQRALFSNEAGIGSASIAHSAAATAEPVREGIVSLLEPFIDTVLVCNATAILVVVAGTWESGGTDGVLVTSRAFATVFPWFPYVLTVAVFLFAYAAILSWCYYGDRCATWLFGGLVGEERASLAYKLVFLACTVAGPMMSLGPVLELSDLMILGMAFPNLVGAVWLSGDVVRAVRKYAAEHGLRAP